MPAKTPSAVKSAGRAVATSGRSYDSPVSVPHLKDSDIRRSRIDGINASGTSNASAEIESEMAGMRAEWSERRREMRSVSTVLPASGELGVQPAGPEDIRVTDRMLAVERKYAPQYVNCRIRIRLLESSLTDASGPTRDALLRKLEHARSELADVDKAYKSELEIARLKTTAMIGKDDGVRVKQDGP